MSKRTSTILSVAAERVLRQSKKQERAAWHKARETALTLVDIIIVSEDHREEKKSDPHLTFPKAPIPKVLLSRYRPMTTGMFSIVPGARGGKPPLEKARTPLSLSLFRVLRVFCFRRERKARSHPTPET